MKHGVYVATKNRESDIFKFLDSLTQNNSNYEIILIDSTEPEERFSIFRDTIMRKYPNLKITHIFHVGRLPSARNAGLELGFKHDLVHFFDDDVTIENDYFKKIEKFMGDNPDVYGGGPRIKGIYLPNELTEETLIRDLLRRLKNTRLRFRNYGQVSGGCKHHWVPDKDGIDQVVDWIPGCCMFFKPEVFEKYKFNNNMENGFDGYAFGEDLEFTFRASRTFKFMATDLTIVEHHLAPSPRSDLDFIAGCLGATTAHMYSMFPEHFSRFKIYAAKIVEFFNQSFYLPKNRIKTFFHVLSKFHKEFTRELRELNWRIET